MAGFARGYVPWNKGLTGYKIAHAGPPRYCPKCRKRPAFCSCRRRFCVAKFNREAYMADVRQTIFKRPHAYKSQTHCLECLRGYKRISMQLYRAEARGDNDRVIELRQVLDNAKEKRKLLRVRNVKIGLTAIA